MTLKKILLNRIIFGLIPIIVLFGLFIYFNDLGLTNFFEKAGMIGVFFLLAIFILAFDFTKNWKKLKNRNKVLESPKLQEAPDSADINGRISFLNKALSIKDNIIDITSNNELILHLNKEKQQVELRKLWGKKILKFNDIEYIFLEYNEYNMYAPRLWFGLSEAYDRTIWKNCVMLKMKEGTEVKLFEAKIHETNNEASEEYRITGDYRTKSYLSNGEKIIRLFSSYMNKRYLIIGQD